MTLKHRQFVFSSAWPDKKSITCKLPPSRWQRQAMMNVSGEPCFANTAAMCTFIFWHSESIWNNCWHVFIVYSDILSGTYSGIWPGMWYLSDLFWPVLATWTTSLPDLWVCTPHRPSRTELDRPKQAKHMVTWNLAPTSDDNDHAVFLSAPCVRMPRSVQN